MVRIAAGFGLVGLVLGAFGAHGLKKTFDLFGTLALWETATFYLFVHALALLSLGAARHVSRTVASLWMGGMIVFSGSLYLLAVTNLKWLGMITPLGGLALLAGWGLLLVRGR